MSEHGYTDDGDNCDPPLDHDLDSELIKGDICGVLCYRSKSKPITDDTSIIISDNEDGFPAVATPSLMPAKSCKSASSLVPVWLLLLSLYLLSLHNRDLSRMC